MSPKDDLVYIKHINEALDHITQFTKGQSLEDINSNFMLSFAVIRAFEIMGEASTKISKAFRDAHPELPWKNMVGFRNRLIHNYFDVDTSVVWQTIQEDLPDLKLKVTSLLTQTVERKPLKRNIGDDPPEHKMKPRR
jgi:uncharacterized protein with HEPN domain